MTTPPARPDPPPPGGLRSSVAEALRDDLARGRFRPRRPPALRIGPRHPLRRPPPHRARGGWRGSGARAGGEPPRRGHLCPRAPRRLPARRRVRLHRSHARLGPHPLAQALVLTPAPRRERGAGLALPPAARPRLRGRVLRRRPAVALFQASFRATASPTCPGTRARPSSRAARGPACPTTSRVHRLVPPSPRPSAPPPPCRPRRSSAPPTSTPTQGPPRRARNHLVRRRPRCAWCWPIPERKQTGPRRRLFSARQPP
jgi:hypothetical protein